MPRPTYGHTHQQTRKRWAPLVATGHVTCARCQQPIPPNTPWDLGHTDDGTSYQGPEHADCNRAAGARKANANRRRRGHNPTSRHW